MKLIASFGFKYGRPLNPDRADGTWSDVYDVRGLPNPYVLYGRTKTGLDSDIQAFVLNNPMAQEIIANICADNRDYVAVGCHGGKDRSVAVVEEIARRTGAKVCHLNRMNWPS
jgi:UPF0042 nucleotide-binding protein